MKSVKRFFMKNAYGDRPVCELLCMIELALGLAALPWIAFLFGD